MGWSEHVWSRMTLLHLVHLHKSLVFHGLLFLGSSLTAQCPNHEPAKALCFISAFGVWWSYNSKFKQDRILHIHSTQFHPLCRLKSRPNVAQIPCRESQFPSFDLRFRCVSCSFVAFRASLWAVCVCSSLDT